MQTVSGVGNSNKPSLLIAEDNQLTNIGLKFFCIHLKYENTTFVEDGKPALEAFKSRSFDLIFTDLFMHEMHGIELIKEVRSLERKVVEVAVSFLGAQSKEKEIDPITLIIESYYQVPIILSSSEPDAEKLAEGAGVNFFLPKIVKLGDFKKTIESFLPQLAAEK